MKRFTTGCVLFFCLGAALSAFSQGSNSALRDQVQKGVAALEAGDFPAAEQHFKTALKMDPGLAEVRANLALAYYATHQYQLAIPQFRTALKQNPALATARSFLPLSLAAVGQCREAIPELNQEFDKASNAKLRRIMGLSLVNCYMQTGYNIDAAEVAAKLVAGYPDDPDVLYVSGQLYGRLSNQLYMRLMKVAPNSARSYQVMASVAAADGNWQRAIDAYRHALRMDPSLQGAHLQIAVLLLTHSPDPNIWQPALAELKQELKVNPSSSEAEYEIGEIYRKHGQLNQAVEAFNRSLQLDPSAVPARIGLAKALNSLGRKQEALASLMPAQKTAPDDADVHFLLAQLYRELGRSQEARSQREVFERLKRAQDVKVVSPER
jgi:tetratricopeptide (TPR) repeat protein